MTSQQDQIALRTRLEEVLGQDHAATLMTMLPQRNDLASDFGDIRREFTGLRSELAALRWDMMHHYATKDDVFALMDDMKAAMRSCIRKLIVVQATTVMVMSTILFGLLRFF